MTTAKQLTFGANFAPPRPTNNKERMEQLHIDWLTQVVLDWTGEPQTKKAFNEIRKGVQKLSRYERTDHNGYNIASNLENYCGIEPDSALVSTLDESSLQESIIKQKLLTSWIQDYNIIPLLEVGETATTKDKIGQITKIDNFTAKYYIKYDDETLVVPFEDVKEHMLKQVEL